MFFHRYLIQISLFVTYFGTCSVYAVIISENLRQIVEHYSGTCQNERLLILGLLLPLILLSWIPNLKYLAPVSMVANVFMAVGLGITFYYLVTDLPPMDTLPLTAPIEKFPEFFGITVFAMEAIGKYIVFIFHFSIHRCYALLKLKFFFSFWFAFLNYYIFFRFEY